jgi:hypothetical protein
LGVFWGLFLVFFWLFLVFFWKIDKNSKNLKKKIEKIWKPPTKIRQKPTKLTKTDANSTPNTTKNHPKSPKKIPKSTPMTAKKKKNLLISRYFAGVKGTATAGPTAVELNATAVPLPVTQLSGSGSGSVTRVSERHEHRVWSYDLYRVAEPRGVAAGLKISVTGVENVPVTVWVAVWRRVAVWQWQWWCGSFGLLWRFWGAWNGVNWGIIGWDSDTLVEMWLWQSWLGGSGYLTVWQCGWRGGLTVAVDAGGCGGPEKLGMGLIGTILTEIATHWWNKWQWLYFGFLTVWLAVW